MTGAVLDKKSWSPWSPERTDRLKELAKDGKSAREIAEDLGGVSRNSVIGKAQRMGIRLNGQQPTLRVPCTLPATVRPKRANGDATDIDRVRKIKEAEAQEAQRQAMEAEAERRYRERSAQAPPSRNVPLVELNGGCKWPTNDHPFLFCGHERSDAADVRRPYCPFHEKAAGQMYRRPLR